mmetsp:Transcript_92510/g.163601  ORF Transcript_92510/g.163601 Transcript_92510/m.163601 type:complete len:484 (+) Transcript_92510:139-1590(+)
MSLSVRCQCACSDQLDPAAGADTANIVRCHDPIAELEEVSDLDSSSDRLLRPRPPHERGVQSFLAGLRMPLVGPPVREGEVWHLLHEDGKSFEPAILSLYSNGFAIRPENGGAVQEISWSPFSLVQACRLHSVQADEALPWLRLFKVSVFHHGTAHFFAARAENADAERARWVADIARGLRQLTQSLFPPFRIRAEPVQGAGWTSTRLLAGYMLMCDNQDVSLVYCELHTHWDCTAAFAVYEDECCDARVMQVSMGVHTCISERVGVDCSCFSIDGHHFTTRTSAEKVFWLRAISNVKVKLRHKAHNPSQQELVYYRSSVIEGVKNMKAPQSNFPNGALLQRKKQRQGGNGPASNVGISTLLAPQTAKSITRAPVMAVREPTNPDDKQAESASNGEQETDADVGGSRGLGGPVVQVPASPLLLNESSGGLNELPPTSHPPSPLVSVAPVQESLLKKDAPREPTDPALTLNPEQDGSLTPDLGN